MRVVELLLGHGADRNLVNADGETALASAEKWYSECADENFKKIIDLLKANS